MDIIVDVMENGYNTSHITDSQKKQMDLKSLFMTLTCLSMAGKAGYSIIYFILRGNCVFMDI